MYVWPFFSSWITWVSICEEQYLYIHNIFTADLPPKDYLSQHCHGLNMTVISICVESYPSICCCACCWGNSIIIQQSCFKKYLLLAFSNGEKLVRFNIISQSHILYLRDLQVLGDKIIEKCGWNVQYLLDSILSLCNYLKSKTLQYPVCITNLGHRYQFCTDKSMNCRGEPLCCVLAPSSQLTGD